MPATSPAKAILAAVAAAVASFLATVQGRTDLASMKAIDWIIVILSACVTGLGVYLVPNKPTTNRRGDLGQTNLLYILLVVAAFLVVLWLLFVLIPGR